MILSGLHLENFKQFREAVDLAPPEGAVGVVGANGSGKTTLFEAILWAFFGSRGGGARFSNDSIPWSGGSTSDRTLVEVTLDLGTSSYTVSRSLKSGKVQAAVHDRSTGREMAGGTSEVSGWVQRHLLAMDRTAFEATFFARQKELAFFSGVEGVSRRREVARLLSLNQIEAAQKLLRSDRNSLRAEANALESLVSGTDGERLEADLEAARKRFASLEAEEKRAAGELDRRAAELSKAREEAGRLEGLYREHNRLNGELGRADAGRERAEERAAELRLQLDSIAEDEKVAEEIRPKTLGLGDLIREIELLEAARRREERISDIKKERTRLLTEAHRNEKRAFELIEELDGEGVPLSGWDSVFEHEEDADQIRAACKVLESAVEARREAERRLSRLTESVRRHGELDRSEERLAALRRELEAAREELGRLEAEFLSRSGEGRPESRAEALRRELLALGRRSAQRAGLAEAEEREAAKLARARRMIEESDEHARCPTCQRGYERDEHAEVIESLRAQEMRLLEDAAASRHEVERLERESDDLARDLEATERLVAEIADLRERRTAQKARCEGLLQSFEEAEREAEALRRELADAPRPTDRDLAAAERRLSLTGMLCEAGPRLAGLLLAYEGASEAAEEKAKEAESLSGGEPYDGERHRSLEERRSEVQALAGRLEALEARISRRGEIEDRLHESVAAREDCKREATSLRKEVEALGFDEEAYVRAREAATRAEQLRDEAREARESAGRGLREAQGEVEALEKELARYRAQREAADEKAREAESLGSMDGLFSEFHSELTARIRPRLEAEASELVRDLTDGRYTRLEFDENYGVRLYDGLSDAYDISRFSGGEADVASLCARIALSKFVAGHSAGGAGTLGFVVLDEVFGALDAGRRRNVLLALDRLKRMFGQIFIISHVSDVQESGLLDETWFVEENEEGQSTVRVVAHDAALSAGALGAGV